MSGKLFFIVNPIAGFRHKKKKILHQIERDFRDQQYEIYYTSGRGDATRAARQAAAEGFSVIVAVGGDGTVNEVASGLVDTDAAMGIVPSGSGNGLARSLGIPLRPSGALALLKTGGAKQIDLGRAGHRFFCAVSGIGIDAVVGHAFDRSSRRGPLPYFLLSARELSRFRPESVRVTIDGESLQFEPLLLTCANATQFGNGAIIAPAARCDDGFLDLCLVPNLPKWQVAAAVPRLFSGSLDRHPRVQYRKVQRVIIEKETPILYHVDGEPEKIESPLEIEILPRALRVVAPAETAKPSDASEEKPR